LQKGKRKGRNPELAALVVLSSVCTKRRPVTKKKEKNSKGQSNSECQRSEKKKRRMRKREESTKISHVKNKGKKEARKKGAHFQEHNKKRPRTGTRQ